MVTIILLIALIPVGVLAYFLARDLLKRRKTSAAALAATTMTKVELAIDKLNENLKTPEVVEKEVKENVELLYSQKAEEFKSLLDTISDSIRTANLSLRSIATSMTSLYSKMNQIKDRVQKGEYPKEEAVSLIAASMTSIKNLESMEKSTHEKIKILEKQKLGVTMKSEMFVSRFNIAKTDIMAKIAQLKLNRTMNIATDSSINISSIMDSLNVKIEREENAAAINETFFKDANNGEDFSLNLNPSDEMKKKAEDFLD